MTITIELTPEQERQICESAAQQDIDAILRLVSETAVPVVLSQLKQNLPANCAPMSDEEHETLLAEVDAELSVIFGLDLPVLNDCTFNREEIYEDHP